MPAVGPGGGQQQLGTERLPGGAAGAAGYAGEVSHVSPCTLTALLLDTQSGTNYLQTAPNYVCQAASTSWNKIFYELAERTVAEANLHEAAQVFRPKLSEVSAAVIRSNAFQMCSMLRLTIEW